MTQWPSGFLIHEMLKDRTGIEAQIIKISRKSEVYMKWPISVLHVYGPQYRRTWEILLAFVILRIRVWNYSKWLARQSGRCQWWPEKCGNYKANAIIKLIIADKRLSFWKAAMLSDTFSAVEIFERTIQDLCKSWNGGIMRFTASMPHCPLAHLSWVQADFCGRSKNCDSQW